MYGDGDGSILTSAANPKLGSASLYYNPFRDPITAAVSSSLMAPTEYEPRQPIAAPIAPPSRPPPSPQFTPMPITALSGGGGGGVYSAAVPEFRSHLNMPGNRYNNYMYPNPIATPDRPYTDPPSLSPPQQPWMMPMGGYPLRPLMQTMQTIQAREQSLGNNRVKIGIGVAAVILVLFTLVGSILAWLYIRHYFTPK